MDYGDEDGLEDVVSTILFNRTEVLVGQINGSQFVLVTYDERRCGQ